MTLAFSPNSPDVFLVGTEDGPIHKCSTAYNDQYLGNYLGHSGPVYTVRYSLLDPSRFFSASADWTIRVWQEDDSQPVAVLSNPGRRAFQDAAWSQLQPSLLLSIAYVVLTHALRTSWKVRVLFFHCFLTNLDSLCPGLHQRYDGTAVGLASNRDGSHLYRYLGRKPHAHCGDAQRRGHGEQFRALWFFA